MEPQALQSFL
jgi:fumarylacetoacetase